MLCVCVDLGSDEFCSASKDFIKQSNFFLDLCARDRAIGDQVFLLFGLIDWRPNVSCLFNIWFCFLFIWYWCQEYFFSNNECKLYARDLHFLEKNLLLTFIRLYLTDNIACFQSLLIIIKSMNTMSCNYFPYFSVKYFPQ